MRHRKTTMILLLCLALAALPLRALAMAPGGMAHGNGTACACESPGQSGLHAQGHDCSKQQCGQNTCNHCGSCIISGVALTSQPAVLHHVAAGLAHTLEAHAFRSVHHHPPARPPLKLRS